MEQLSCIALREQRPSTTYPRFSSRQLIAPFAASQSLLLYRCVTPQPSSQCVLCRRDRISRESEAVNEASRTTKAKPWLQIFDGD